jgi:putative transposase
VVAFISISSRRVEYFAITSKPDTPWMLQQARKLLMELDDHDRHVRFLIHDRDAKFPRAFDALVESDGIKCHPDARARTERERADGALGRHRPPRMPRPAADPGRYQLEHVLRAYVTHYNAGRPHRALDLKPPDPMIRPTNAAAATLCSLQVDRRDLLGGLIHEYELAAA